MVSHTQDTPCPTVSVSVAPRHHPEAHKLPSPPPTGHNRQSCCPMSRLFPVVVLQVLGHCLFLQGFPVVRLPVRPGPAWETQPEAREPAAGTLGPSAPLMLAGPVEFSPIQSPQACAGSTERESGACPLPGCPGLCSMAHPRVAWKKLTLSYSQGHDIGPRAQSEAAGSQRKGTDHGWEDGVRGFES